METSLDFYIETYEVNVLKSVSNDKTIHVEVEGIISHEDPDTSGEVIVQKGLDFSYFLKTGRLKNEHTPRGQQEDPKQRVGFPLDVTLMPNGYKEFKGPCTVMKGVIYAEAGTEQYPVAKAIADDIRNMESVNKLYGKNYPKAKKGMCFSVEGQGIKKGFRIERMLVTDVVFTTKPVHPKAELTYAKVCKSLMAGNSVNPQTMCGGNALSKESIQGKHSNKKNNKKMDRTILVEFYKGLGFDETVAGQKADARIQRAADVQKSLEDNLEPIQKSLKDIANFNKEILTAGETKVEDIRKSIKDAMVPNSDNQVDVDKFLSKIGAASVEANNFQITNARHNNAVLESICKSIETVLNNQSELNARIDDLFEKNEFTETKVIDIGKSLNRTLPDPKKPGAGNAGADGTNTVDMNTSEGMVQIQKAFGPSVKTDAQLTQKSIAIRGRIGEFLLNQNIAGKITAEIVSAAKSMDYDPSRMFHVPAMQDAITLIKSDAGLKKEIEDYSNEVALNIN